MGILYFFPEDSSQLLWQQRKLIFQDLWPKKKKKIPSFDLPNDFSFLFSPLYSSTRKFVNPFKETLPSPLLNY